MLSKVFSQKAAEYGTGLLVFVSAGLAGHQWVLGMTQAQLMGAATALLGSVMAAVMVRLWTPEDSDGDGDRIPIRIRIRKDD
jgi:hypothetical protein